MTPVSNWRYTKVLRISNQKFKKFKIKMQIKFQIKSMMYFFKLDVISKKSNQSVIQ